MKRNNASKTVVLIAALMIGGVGCNGDTSTSGTSDVETAPPPGTVDKAHPSHGPHDGELIELGNEDYHAELVHSDDDEIIIYILGSDAKTAVPIDATEVGVNALHDGKPEQFQLAALADEGDPEGKSSRFTSSDAELSEHVHDEASKAKMVVVIDGKQYTGKIPHSHGDDHGHSHE